MEPESEDIKKILEDMSARNEANPHVMELVFPYDNELIVFEVRDAPIVQYLKHALRKRGIF